VNSGPLSGAVHTGDTGDMRDDEGERIEAMPARARRLIVSPADRGVLIVRPDSPPCARAAIGFPVTPHIRAWPSTVDQGRTAEHEGREGRSITTLVACLDRPFNEVYVVGRKENARP